MAVSSITNNYVILEGLSIEMTPSGNEVFFTPDIDITTNSSIDSATSSVYGETGAPVVKHLYTFSEEERDEDEIDLFNFSISSTKEEEERTTEARNVMKGVLATNKEVGHDMENNCLPGQYRRPLNPFGKITSVAPPSTTSNKGVIRKDIDQNSPRVLGEQSINSPLNSIKVLSTKVTKVDAPRFIKTSKEDVVPEQSVSKLTDDSYMRHTH
jgi:hypothetical protein